MINKIIPCILLSISRNAFSSWGSPCMVKIELMSHTHTYLYVYEFLECVKCSTLPWQSMIRLLLFPQLEAATEVSCCLPGKTQKWAAVSFPSPAQTKPSSDSVIQQPFARSLLAPKAAWLHKQAELLFGSLTRIKCVTQKTPNWRNSCRKGPSTRSSEAQSRIIRLNQELPEIILRTGLVHCLFFHSGRSCQISIIQLCPFKTLAYTYGLAKSYHVLLVPVFPVWKNIGKV